GQMPARRAPRERLVGQAAVVGRLLAPDAGLAKVHQDTIGRQPIEPSGEGRLAAKAAELAHEMNEYLLRNIFSLRNVAGHAQAQTIDAPMITPIDLLECLQVSGARSLHQLLLGADRLVAAHCGRDA